MSPQQAASQVKEGVRELMLMHDDTPGSGILHQVQDVLNADDQRPFIQYFPGYPACRSKFS